MLSLRALLRGWLGLCAMLSMLVWSSTASAYSWMIRHEYSSCQTCHLDPSGGGILTQYGRAQSELLLRTRWGELAEDEDPTKLGNFLFGAVNLPEQLLLQADVRTLLLAVKPPAPTPWQTRYILMQGDAAAGLALGRLRVSGTLGVVSEGASGAQITRGEDFKLVGRQYWAGAALGKDEQFLLRAGRINLPFGLRILEHTAWARSETRTDINAAQQHGVAFAWTEEQWRAEIMGIAGNFALRPYSLHEYGYAGYLERGFGTKVALGVSSLLTYTGKEIEAQVPATRQAHGVFARYAPHRKVVLMGEADLLVRSVKDVGTRFGAVGLLQLDFEAVQGLHFIGTGEFKHAASEGQGLGYGGWLSSAWFFMPHMDFRIDAIVRNEAYGPSRYTIPSLLAQFHAFL